MLHSTLSINVFLFSAFELKVCFIISFIVLNCMLSAMHFIIFQFSSILFYLAKMLDTSSQVFIAELYNLCLPMLFSIWF